jgi:hypothetical protein
MSQQAHSGLCNWADVDVVPWGCPPSRGPPTDMSAQRDPNAGASREQARARLRTLTSSALLAATGATVGIAIVVAHEHPGKSAAGATTSGQSTGGTAGTTGTTGNSGSSSTEDTGNSGASTSSPSISSQTPSVTSGGSHR